MLCGVPLDQGMNSPAPIAAASSRGGRVERSTRLRFAFLPVCCQPLLQIRGSPKLQ